MTTSTGVFVFADGASAPERLCDDARPAIPLVTGVALKLAAASKTAEIDSRTIERATRSAQAWVELCCFFIELFGVNQFSCFSARLTGLRIAEISRRIGEVLRLGGPALQLARVRTRRPFCLLDLGILNLGILN